MRSLYKNPFFSLNAAIASKNKESEIVRMEAQQLLIAAMQ